MPITMQARKKMRRDRRRTQENSRQRRELHDAVKKARTSPTKKSLSAAYRTLDKAAKKGHIHRNKASRLKSRLAKHLKAK